MTHGRRAGDRDQTAIGSARESVDGLLDLGGITHVDRDHLDPERRRHSLDSHELANREPLAGVAQDCHAREARRQLL